MHPSWCGCYNRFKQRKTRAATTRVFQKEGGVFTELTQCNLTILSKD